jgi:hypothetical protein
MVAAASQQSGGELARSLRRSTAIKRAAAGAAVLMPDCTVLTQPAVVLGLQRGTVEPELDVVDGRRPRCRCSPCRHLSYLLRAIDQEIRESAFGA